MPKVTQWQHLDLRSGNVDPKASAPALWAKQCQKEVGTPEFESLRGHPRDAPGLGPAHRDSATSDSPLFPVGGAPLTQAGGA